MKTIVFRWNCVGSFDGEQHLLVQRVHKSSRINVFLLGHCFPIIVLIGWNVSVLIRKSHENKRNNFLAVIYFPDTAYRDSSHYMSTLTRQSRPNRQSSHNRASTKSIALRDLSYSDNEDNSDDNKKTKDPMAIDSAAEAPRSPQNDVTLPPLAPLRAIGFPDAKIRRTGLQIKEGLNHRTSGPGGLARRTSGRRWRAHPSDYDEVVARAQFFKPRIPPTHTSKRRVAVYYTCEQILLFKLQQYIKTCAKEFCRAEASETHETGTAITQTPAANYFANWKNTMYLEVLHSISMLPQTIETLERTDETILTQRTAALQEKHVFVFERGCCVFWGLSREEESWHLMMLAPFFLRETGQVDPQVMDFSYGDRSSIAKDTIVLCSMTVAEKIAISFAMSQSATLGAFETRVGDRIRSTRHIPSSLASVGSIQYSQDDTSKLIGQLFIELADVNIHSNVLDEPEYFFNSQDNDDFKYLYEKMLKYQDVANRVAILNKRLSILRDLVGVLNQQLTHHQGSKLEWIIIWMLVFQVIIAIGWEIFLKDIMGCFR
ncbi:hypothetical protein CCR75_000333 [Bremia lactucae]|uniref:DUF155 domain-containing protein n=1 Tax=Bremia lactucae TaxID=4779 RepID=A0A976IDS8_BRELC|nr:hypothetical protein CCR75_000333 [Bremia lactucae]